MGDLTSIPGSFVDDATRRIRWIRGQDIVKPEYGVNARSYTAEVSDGLLIAMVAQEEVKVGVKLWHLSVSHKDKSGKPDRYASWDEIKHAKYQLVPVDVPMVLIFPRKNVEYIDAMATCLHLWESTEEDIDK